MDIVSLIIGFAVGGLIFGIVCFFAGISHRKKKAEGILGSAEEESKRILNDALKNAEARKKESILEAKDEIHRLRTESEKENRERRSELQRQERRLQQKEEALDKKIDNIAAAIEEGIVTQTTKERLTALEAQREELQISIFEEETSHPKLTKEYVVQWLKSFKQRDLRDPKVQRQVIECFVNTVYVFENKLIVNLNLRDGDKPIALSKGNGSDIETFGSP